MHEGSMLIFRTHIPRKLGEVGPILGNDFHVLSYRILRHPNVSYTPKVLVERVLYENKSV